MAKVLHKNTVTGRALKRGALPSTRQQLLRAKPFVSVGDAPVQFIVLPAFLEMWLNDEYGDCVSAEECAAKALYSVSQGLPEVRISDSALLSFCNDFGFLNGATLTDVMDAMISTGITDSGITYKDGNYVGVDFSNEALLRNAIAQGPVKLGIDADALPMGAGNGSGWFAFGGTPGEYSNEDHCINVNGYGLASIIFAALNKPLPSGVSSDKPVYIIYTWSGLGVVDHDWIMSCCGEAWLRVPTTALANDMASNIFNRASSVNWNSVIQFVEAAASTLVSVLQYFFPGGTRRRR